MRSEPKRLHGLAEPMAQAAGVLRPQRKSFIEEKNQCTLTLDIADDIRDERSEGSAFRSAQNW